LTEPKPNPYAPSQTASKSDRESWWSRVEPDERRAVGWATAWFFLILLGYFVVRPVRDTVSTIDGTRQLQYLFLGTFLAMLVAVPIYSALVSRLPRRWLVRVVFHFFAACLFGFFLLMRVDSPEVQKWTARAFFIWVSIFGVFSTSIFWSVMADVFTSKQGRRLFGLIAAGGTVGAFSGSLITSQLATQLSTERLLLIPIAIIEAGLWCAWRLEKQVSKEQTLESKRERANQDGATGGGLLTGITHVFRSSYLASICLFLFFVQACGTQMYFEQAEIVKAAIEDKGSRTELFAYIDLGAQLLTLLVQTCVSGLVLRRLGVSAALVVLPIVYAIGFTSLAIYPTLSVLVVVVIIGRAAGYGITVPTREVLFTVVDREDKYKSKSFIDTVVLRGGDMASGQIFGSLRNGLGIGLTALNLYVLPFVAIWAATAWQLGRQQKKLADQQQQATAVLQESSSELPGLT